MQVVLPLDSTLDLIKYAASKPAEPDPLQDYLKITIGKLYRVNGSTAQNIGVVPEVHLPDFFEAVDYTERSYPTSLKADTVASKLVYRASPQKVSKTVLEDFEKTSVQADPEFIETQRLIRMQQLSNVAKQIPLKLAEYNEWYNSGYSDKTETVANKKQETAAPYKVRNTRQDADYNAMDSFQKENDEAIIQELTDDASIKQVYLLIKKMLETTK
jgi:carboxyl-terminal processing protease